MQKAGQIQRVDGWTERREGVADDRPALKTVGAVMYQLVSPISNVIWREGGTIWKQKGRADG